MDAVCASRQPVCGTEVKDGLEEVGDMISVKLGEAGDAGIERFACGSV